VQVAIAAYVGHSAHGYYRYKSKNRAVEVAIAMHGYKYPFSTKVLLFAFIALLFFVDAEAQVVVDVSKITCDQFATYKIENPEYIAIWLDGYYHGTRGDMKVDIQTLSADAKKVEMYCLSKPEVPLVQAVKTVLGISVGP
jgi:acid stress chaperone HdeB